VLWHLLHLLPAALPVPLHRKHGLAGLWQTPLPSQGRHFPSAGLSTACPAFLPTVPCPFAPKARTILIDRADEVLHHDGWPPLITLSA